MKKVEEMNIIELNEFYSILNNIKIRLKEKIQSLGVNLLDESKLKSNEIEMLKKYNDLTHYMTKIEIIIEENIFLNYVQKN